MQRINDRPARGKRGSIRGVHVALVLSAIVPSAPLPAAAQQSTAQAAEASPVRIAAVTRGTVVETETVVGALFPVQEAMIAPGSPGNVTAVLVKSGQRVKRGDPMFQLDDRAARADLEVAGARLKVAQGALHRAQELIRTGNFPLARLDELNGDSTTAAANLGAAQARLDLLTLRAPFDGEIGVFQLSPGTFVQMGASLVRLSDDSALVAHFRVRQALLPRLSTGQRFTVRGDALGPGRVLEGQVTVIDSQADQNTRAIEVRGDVRNGERGLAGGLQVRIELELARRDGQLLVPIAALVPGMASDQAFMVRDGEARLVPVRVGVRRDGAAEVLSGLAEGDQVVTVGQFRLQDGGKVRPVAEGDPSALPAAAAALAPPQGR